MQRSKIINTNKKIYLHKYIPGSKGIMDLAHMEHKCFNEACDAKIKLCSYLVESGSIPYFKSSTSLESHNPGCDEKNNENSPMVKASVEKNGQSAFNQLFKKYAGLAKLGNDAFAAKAKHETTRKNTTGSNSAAKMASRVKHIKFDDTYPILDKCTYLIHSDHINNFQESGDYVWINIGKDNRLGVGVKGGEAFKNIDSQKDKFILIIIPSNIKEQKNTRQNLESNRYTYSCKYILVKNKKIVDHNTGNHLP